MEKKDTTATRTSIFVKYRDILLLNKNLLISGVVGFFVSALAAELYAKYNSNDLATSFVTVLMGYVASGLVFTLIFHSDNKHKYIDTLTGKINIRILKQILKKIVAATSIFDLVNNISRFVIIYALLEFSMQPFDASMISSSCFGISLLFY